MLYDILTAALLVFTASMAFAIPNPQYWEEYGTYPPNYPTRTFDGELDADTTHSFDQIVLHAEFTPDIVARNFEAVIELTVVVMEADLTEIGIHLANSTVHSTTIDEETAENTYTDDNLVITIGDNYELGDTVTVVISYEGNIGINHFFGGMVYGSTNDVLYTFGEPYETRHWLACYDFPYDKLNETQLSFILDSDYTVAANGALVEVTDLGEGLTRTTWLNTEPISTYLVAFAAAEYVEVSGGEWGINDTPLTYWVYADNPDEYTEQFSFTGPMLELFEDLFGPYPFAKYDQAMAQIFTGWGAMEHQGCTTFGDRLIMIGEHFADGIVAHELAHMWWGDYVGPFTFAHIWLNESFATYSAALWFESVGEEEFDNRMDNYRSQYWNEDSQVRYAVFNPPPEHLFGTAIYDGGALRLHMLRYLLGDEDFFAGMQNYAQTYGYGSAATEEFKTIMETESGVNLDAFFDEWIYDAGYPVYQFYNASFPSNGDGTWDVVVQLTQSQSNAPFFSIPLPFLVTGNGGEEEIIRMEVDPEFNQILRYEGLTFAPTEIYFDPEEWILCSYTFQSVDEHPSPIPIEYFISEPWPNPFNSSISIRFGIATNREVAITVYDLLGRKVAELANDSFDGGYHQIMWQPDETIGSGSYLIKVDLQDVTEIKRITLLK